MWCRNGSLQVPRQILVGNTFMVQPARFPFAPTTIPSPPSGSKWVCSDNLCEALKFSFTLFWWKTCLQVTSAFQFTIANTAGSGGLSCILTIRGFASLSPDSANVHHPFMTHSGSAIKLGSIHIWYTLQTTIIPSEGKQETEESPSKCWQWFWGSQDCPVWVSLSSLVCD